MLLNQLYFLRFMHTKYISGLALLLFFLMSTTCLRAPEELAPVYDKTWLHAVEEDSAEVEVYRPNTYAFPPSRGRTGFSLSANGTFRLFSIAPTDGLEEHPGRWKKISNDLLRISFEGEQPEGFDLQIISLTPDLLKIKKIPTKAPWLWAYLPPLKINFRLVTPLFKTCNTG